MVEQGAALFVDQNDRERFYTDDKGIKHQILYREVGAYARMGILSNPEVVSSTGVMNIQRAMVELAKVANIRLDGEPVDEAKFETFSQSFLDWLGAEGILGGAETLKDHLI